MSKTITDPELGKLKFQEVEGMLSYSCKLTLPGSTKQVDIFFDTDSVENTPTLAQKQFLQRIVEQYNDVLDSIASNLPEDIASHKPHELKENFELDTVGIPHHVEENAKWDLSLINRTEKNMILLAKFEGMKPIKVWTGQTTQRPFLLKLLLKIVGVR